MKEEFILHWYSRLHSQKIKEINELGAMNKETKTGKLPCYKQKEWRSRMSVEHGIKVYKKTHYKTTIGDHELGEEAKHGNK